MRRHVGCGCGSRGLARAVGGRSLRPGTFAGTKTLGWYERWLCSGSAYATTPPEISKFLIDDEPICGLVYVLGKCAQMSTGA